MVKNLIKDSYLALLKVLARLEMTKHKKALIIGITGSSGKTSCKDMVVAFLKPHYKNTLKYTKKGNSETGIPYEILNIPVRHYKIWEYPFVLMEGLFTVLFSFKKFDIFIIEYGIDSPDAPNNMDYLLSIVKPTISILLSISSVHGVNFEKLVDETVPDAKRVEAIQREIAKEKIKLLQAVTPKNAFITTQAASFLTEKDIQGMNILEENNQLQLTTWENTTTGITITLSTPKGDLTTTIPDLALPVSAKKNILIASMLVQSLKKDLRTSMAKLAENYHINPGRSSILPGINGTILLDSSYNANPMAAKELFPIVKEIAKRGRRKKIIILGDFRELGHNKAEIYKSVINEAAKVADILVLTNAGMKEFGIPAAEDAGLILNENLFWFQNGKQLSFHINEIIEKNSVILFEGSQNTVFLEYAVHELCAIKDKKYILSHIPRMSRDWLEIK